jgi:hypothetical protein
MKDILTVDETALFLKKHPDTIRSWILNKKLKARKISGGKNGVFVLLRTDILELMVTESIKKDSHKSNHKHPLKSSSQVRLPI